MSKIGELITEAGVQALVMVVGKISGGAGLGIGQVGKNRSLAAFQLLGFKAGPHAFGLGIVVVVAAPALGVQRLVLVQQGLIGVAAVRAALVRMHQQDGVRLLGEEHPLSGRVINSSGMVAITCQPTPAC